MHEVRAWSHPRSREGGRDRSIRDARRTHHPACRRVGAAVCGWRPARRSPPTRSCATSTWLSRTGRCSGSTPPRVGRARPLLAVVHRVAGRRARGAPGRRRPPQHPLRPMPGARRSTALLRNGRRMPDPSILVTSPTVSDPSLAPDGSTTLFALEPAPNLDGSVDWASRAAAPSRRDRRTGSATLGYPVDDVVVERLTDPARLGSAGPRAGDTVRARAPVLPDRAVPARQRRPPRPRAGVRRHGDGARRRHPDGADLRAPRRRSGRGVGGNPRVSVITLEQSYARCRELNKAYGTTYYAATFVLPRVKRHHVHALYGFCRYADDIVDDLGPAPVDVREKALADFGERFFADLDRRRLRRPGAQGGRPHRAGVQHRSRLLPPVPSLDDDGPDGGELRDVRRPPRVHGRVGGGDRRDDAADPGAVVARRRAARPRPRHRVPAHELPPRRERGPRPRAGVPPAGGPPALRRQTRGERRVTPAWRELMRSRSPAPASTTRRPTSGSRTSRRRRHAASGRRAASTARSSTGSRRRTTTCSPGAPGCPPGGRRSSSPRRSGRDVADGAPSAIDTSRSTARRRSSAGTTGARKP